MEWLVDGFCQFEDLEASLALMQIEDCVERAESRYFRLEHFADILSLWQTRIRYCIDEHEAEGLREILERVADARCDWKDYSKAVCAFRLLAMRNVGELRGERSSLPSWLKGQ